MKEKKIKKKRGRLGPRKPPVPCPHCTTPVGASVRAQHYHLASGRCTVGKRKGGRPIKHVTEEEKRRAHADSKRRMRQKKRLAARAQSISAQTGRKRLAARAQSISAQTGRSSSLEPSTTLLRYVGPVELDDDFFSDCGEEESQRKEQDRERTTK